MTCSCNPPRPPVYSSASSCEDPPVRYHPPCRHHLRCLLLPQSRSQLVAMTSVAHYGVLLMLVVAPIDFIKGFVDGDPSEDLRSAVAMSQLVLAQQAQFFRELINATRGRNNCCDTLGKSDLELQEVCPDPYSTVVGECFYLSPNQLSWHSSRHFCRGMGGDLATPRHLYALKAFITEKRGPKAVWIGGTDLGADGGWRWVNGDTVDSADWAHKQPNNDRPVEQCLHLRRDWHPVLGDLPCHISQRFVCQYIL
ncbi:C-type lectin-like 28 [Homarus americanus]|uniref:C-type lectin-like 28 n=2 Tax=Homarus americanus TaxID=6706 RepID=A0A8J5N886_HOMAM|nr:C-type lectin-like 28 [Homarus americanus]